eukprot:4212490-Alexandrium_andersonii.AAC.1
MCTAVVSDTSAAAWPVRLSTRTTPWALSGRRRSPMEMKTGRLSSICRASRSAWRVRVASCSN